MGDCPICCEPFSAQRRKPVECPGCHAVACRRCVERYLGSAPGDPHCMSCRQPWVRDFLDATMTHAFRSVTLRQQRERTLLERERAMMPATQPSVELVLETRRLQEQRAGIEQRLRDLDAQMADVRRRMQRMDGEGDGPPGEGGDRERRQFIRPCPGDGCRGFLSTAYKCGLCGTAVCPSCHAVKRPDAGGHVCDPEDVASVRQIQRECRPCPKCGTHIFKVSGCSQMFCTVEGCATAFDWDTGRVCTGRIHNPHYYEYMAAHGGAHGRELDDIPCGGLPSVEELTRYLCAALLAALPPTSASAAEVQVSATTSRGQRLEALRHFPRLVAAHNAVLHVGQVEMVHYYPAMEQELRRFTSNLDLRVRYMLGEVGEGEFKHTLQVREKRALRLHAIHQVLATFVNVGSDTLRQLVLAPPGRAAVQDAQDALERLRAYINGSLEEVGRRFKCGAPTMDEGWAVRMR